MSKAIDYGTATFNGVTYTLTSEANHMCCPTPGRTNMWSAFATGPDGYRYQIIWDFSDAEIAAAGEDASSLPWDDDHVAEVHCVS